MMEIRRQNLHSLPRTEVIANPVQHDVSPKFVLLARRELERSTVVECRRELELDFIESRTIVSHELFRTGYREEHTSVRNQHSDVLSFTEDAQAKLLIDHFASTGPTEESHAHLHLAAKHGRAAVAITGIGARRLHRDVRPTSFLK
jgi:hypothetical protein